MIPNAVNYDRHGHPCEAHRLQIHEGNEYSIQSMLAKGGGGEKTNKHKKARQEELRMEGIVTAWPGSLWYHNTRIRVFVCALVC